MVIDLASLSGQFHFAAPSSFRGDLCVVLSRDEFYSFIKILKERSDFDCNLLVDLTAVDYPERQERFQVVYHLYSLRHNHRIRVKVPLTMSQLRLQSLAGLYATANWYEREVFDMFGIVFEGHPDLKRILLPESFEGHPLRKDYPAERRQKIPVPVERP